ncbi:hypothetical protein [Candidatus Epulonipiscium viviparus]|uniref:hypothetical protein n=1 Tax=Candidatus Epulonipiscium viviparus TaxID=420336 RepID=UPI0027380F04|nr:hypothetical protein [Candidatus Epulopiscium viviparus]
MARDDSRDHDRSAAINRTYQNAITEKISHGFTDDEITPITENTLDKNLSKVNTLSQLKNNTRLLSQAEKNTVISHKHEIGSIGHIDNNLDSNNIPSLSLVRGKKDISKEKSINSPKKGFLNDDLNDDEKLDAFVEDFFADDNENDVEFEEEPSLEELAQIERMLSGSFDTPASSALQKMQRKPFEIKSPTKANDLELKKEEEAKAKWNILKQECLEYYGASCEICGMDYGYTYGDKFEHLMDVYNTKSKEKNWDNLNVDPEKDLIPVCHNCSAIIHAKTPHYNVEEVKKFIQNK